MGKKKNKRRSNGNGTLEKRGKNGVYYARWVVNGHKYTKSTGTTIKADAEKVLAALVKPFQAESEIARLANIEAAIKVKRGEMEAEEDKKKPALKLTEAFDAYFKNVNVDSVAEGTERVYLDMFHRLEKFVKSYRGRKVSEMREVTPKMAEDFLTELKAEVRSATYNRYLNFFKLLWRTLKKKARLTCNPWEGNTKLSLDTESRRNLTLDEIKKVIGSVSGEWKTLFLFGYYTGMRLVDCCHVRFENLNMRERTISVVLQKTKRKRPEPIEIPLAPDLFNQIEQIPCEKRSGFIMPMCAKAYDRNLMNYKIKRIFENCGIKTNREEKKGRRICEVGFHSLRSGFVTYAGEAGIPLPVIQMIVGHGSPRMTAHYFRTAKHNLTQCVNAIPSIMGENKERESLVLETETMNLIRSRLMKDENLDDGLRRLLGSLTDCDKVAEAMPSKPIDFKEFMQKPIEAQTVFRKVS